MARSTVALMLGTAALLVCALDTLAAQVPSPAASSPQDAAGGAGTGAMVLTATNPVAADYAPTFTGNGELGIRVPPAGQGYATGNVPATAQLAGFYAQAPGGIQQRVTIPTWSSLTFSDGDVPFSPSVGRIAGWRQTLDLATGVITTSARWTAPDGHTTGLTYQVLTDRADADIGIVRLTMTPAWSGHATVTDAIDGTAATLSNAAGQGRQSQAGRDWTAAEAEGTGITVVLASQLVVGSGKQSTPTAPAALPASEGPESIGQQVTVAMDVGHPVTITKYVAAVSSRGTLTSPAAALSDAADAARSGFQRLLTANDAAWARLWTGRIDVAGDPVLATDVNASEFYLWSSTRAGSTWSISPGGLSSPGYNGHVFWDADTWMYPALLAQHPALAVGIDNYRYARLGAAEQHAAATGYKGARFPWESALDGTEQIPPPDTLFTEGLYEQHVTADVALAQWQYYLATGDRRWLATKGWPVLSAAADFWASRATGSDGTYHIDGVTGPDEENTDVDDEAYTVAAARGTLLDADAAAKALGIAPPPAWRQIAQGLLAPTRNGAGAITEFDGYEGQMVKQADVTLLQYPWAVPLAASTEQADVDYYAPRTDPTGPSMSDAIDAIDTAALGTPGCSLGVYTERSVDPFIHDVFHQFSETSAGGVLTFMTGIGGFLQEFLYGYSGFRWSATGVPLDPALSEPLTGVVLHDLVWRGRTFTVAIASRTTTVTLDAGPPLPVVAPTGRHMVTVGHPLSIPTRQPDAAPSQDLLLCQAAVATSSTPAGPALAAVDGSVPTGWEPAVLPATLTVSLRGGPRTIASAAIRWGQAWPRPSGLNTSAPPGPVTTLRADAYSLAVKEASGWRTVATSSGGTGTTDVVRFPRVRASAVALRLDTGTAGGLPVVDELTVKG